MPAVSVIVPIYNVEKYLPECLDSLLAQTFADWEAILVDDGSPDGCPAICDEYAQRDARFRVVHQKNSGVSAARNAALRVAQGEFVAFLDGDDTLDAQMLENCLGLAKTHSADIVSTGMIHLSEDSVATPCSPPPEKLFRGRSASYGALFDPQIRPSCVTAKLFRRSLFGGIQFPTDMTVSEDAYIVPGLFAGANCVVCAPSADSYRAHIRNNSATGVFRVSNLEQTLRSAEKLVRFTYENFPEYAQEARARYLRVLLFNLDTLYLLDNYRAHPAWKWHRRMLRRRIFQIVFSQSKQLEPLRRRYALATLIWPSKAEHVARAYYSKGRGMHTEALEG